MSDPIQTAPQPDDTAAVITKMIVGIILGPKLSPILISWGIPADPILMSVVISGALHKIHQIVKQQTGYTWL